MRGIIGLIIIVAVLYFTGVGGKVWDNIKTLDTNCYAALARAGSAAGPVCSAVSRGFAYVEEGMSGIGAKLDGIKESIFGSSSSLGDVTSALGDRLTQFASSNDTLTQMMRAGPGSFSGTRTSIQQAIDSFTIGQGYLNQGGAGSSQAVEWFKRGAVQPQGYGLMSQLQLGNLYMTGQGVPQSNQAASAYLQQANSSITTLVQSNTPQSQQLLGTLPASPQQIQSQLQSTIRQLKVGR